MSHINLVKRLRSVRGSFIIPVDSPPVFSWAEEAADTIERQEKLIEEVRSAVMQSRPFSAYFRQGFWHAHHVNIVWRIDGKDKWEEADWLKDIWYALRRRDEVSG